MVKWNHKFNLKLLFFLAFSVCLLFLSFQYNYFKAANQNWFNGYQRDSESLVLGRLVESASNGILSYGGTLGRNSGEQEVTPGQLREMQLGIYIYGKHQPMTMEPYLSQMGLQGMFFSIADSILVFVGINSSANRLAAMHAFCSFLLAVVISLVLTFILSEFGMLSALTVLVFLLFSQWLVVIARNLYWVPFSMYLPMLVTLWALIKDSQGKTISGCSLFTAVAIFIFIRSAAGYEFISTVMLACYAPVIYFALKNSWHWSAFIRNSMLIVSASVVGFLIAYIIHVLQLAFLKNQTFVYTLYDRIHHAKSRMYIEQGAFGSGRWEEATTASVSQVVREYWKGNVIDLSTLLNHPNIFVVKVKGIVLALLLLTVLVFLLRRFSVNINAHWNKLSALLAMAWFSALAPLSWYVLAKVHSYVHTHINHVLWHIPFTFFAIAVIGYVGGLLLKDVKQKWLQGRKIMFLD